MTTKHTITVGILVAIALSAGATAFASSEQTVAEGYATLQTQFVSAYQTFVSHKLPESGVVDTVNAKAYINALIDMLSARVNSMDYLVTHNSGLTSSDRTLLSTNASDEQQALAQFTQVLKDSKNEKDAVTATASGLRNFLLTHDRIMRTTAGFLGAGNLTAVIIQHSQGAMELSTQEKSLADLGADTSVVIQHLKAHDKAIQSAKDLVFSSKKDFANILVSQEPAKDYEAALEELKKASSILSADNSELLFAMNALQELTAALRTKGPAH